ncbi:MAG: tRNA 4-thiouridine(8) synthase ThiI [Clostridia bacterium]|nr:tRNA 4-thiouridine(8) synthase ThiI [Clostridia bacterium]
MEHVLLIRYGEIHLKGLNRPFFENKLINNIKFAVRGMNASVKREQGRIYVSGIADEDVEEAVKKLTCVFGIHSVSPALCVDVDYNTVKETAFSLLPRDEESTFKVYSRRSDKSFPMTSEMINRELGHDILENFPNLQVDIHNPQIGVYVEIRERAYVYTEIIPGAQGMPTGTAGRAALLISGGIDSPVAGYQMAKRGLVLSAVHFFSYPYTGERARDKVVDLAKIVARYSGPIRLHLVPFTDIQMTIYEKCPSKETTVLMRRLMMKISERIAREDGALALITGEALGQVASQTLESLCVTDDAVSMPVFRPLIGFDKDDIVAIAKKIGTFETSILPYEDCCTVFVPQHPVTKPEVKKLRQSEALVDFEPMIEEAIKNTIIMEVG